MADIAAPLTNGNGVSVGEVTASVGGEKGLKYRTYRLSGSHGSGEVGRERSVKSQKSVGSLSGQGQERQEGPGAEAEAEAEAEGGERDKAAAAHGAAPTPTHHSPASPATMHPLRNSSSPRAASSFSSDPSARPPLSSTAPPDPPPRTSSFSSSVHNPSSAPPHPPPALSDPPTRHPLGSMASRVSPAGSYSSRTSPTGSMSSKVHIDTAAASSSMLPGATIPAVGSPLFSPTSNPPLPHSMTSSATGSVAVSLSRPGMQGHAHAQAQAQAMAMAMASQSSILPTLPRADKDGSYGTGTGGTGAVDRLPPHVSATGRSMSSSSAQGPARAPLVLPSSTSLPIGGGGTVAGASAGDVMAVVEMPSSASGVSSSASGKTQSLSSSPIPPRASFSHTRPSADSFRRSPAPRLGNQPNRSFSAASPRPSLSFTAKQPSPSPSMTLVKGPPSTTVLPNAHAQPPGGAGLASPQGALVPPPTPSQIRLESVTLFLTSRRRTQKARAKLLRQKSQKKARKPPGKETIVEPGTVGWYMIMGINQGAQRFLPSGGGGDVKNATPTRTGAGAGGPQVQVKPDPTSIATAPQGKLRPADFTEWHKYAVDEVPTSPGGEVREYEWKAAGLRKKQNSLSGPSRASHDGVGSTVGGTAAASANPMGGGVGVGAVSGAQAGQVLHATGHGSAETSQASLETVKGAKGYDFKFKDYAPRVFAEMRSGSGVGVDEYLASLTTPTNEGKLHLWESGSAGKSGSFFFFTEDGRYIIKTIHHAEHKVFLKMLKGYYEHMVNNPHTLVNRIFGLHRVKLPGEKKIHFVVMENLLPLTRDIECMYDLKGSTWGRVTPAAVVEQNPKAVRKDQNWVDGGRKLELVGVKREMLMAQVARDVKFLSIMGIMDYSLLVGISKRTDRWATIRRMVEEGQLREGVYDDAGWDSVRSLNRPSAPPAAAKSVFRTDFCDGYRSQPATPGAPLPPHVYHLGVIDIFTRYDAVKALEHAVKSVYQSATRISAVNPRFYAKRFVEFVGKEVVGGERADVQRWVAAFEGKAPGADVEGMAAEYFAAKKKRIDAVLGEHVNVKANGEASGGPAGAERKA